MKTKTLIISILLGLLVTVTTIGKTYIPKWALALSVFAVLVCVVYYIIHLFRKEKSILEEQMNALKSNIDKSRDELFNRQKDQITELSNLVDDKFKSLQQLVCEGVDILNKETVQRIASVMEQITSQTAEIEKMFKNEEENIITLEETTKSLSSQILTRITEDSDKVETLLSHTKDLLMREGENIRKVSAESTNSICSLLISQKEEVEKAIVSSTTSIVTKAEEHKESLSSMVSHLSAQAVSARESMRSTLTDMQQSSVELRQIIENNQDTVTEHILKNRIVLSESIDNKAEDVIKQQSSTLLEAVTACSELVGKATETVNSSISQQKAEMMEQLEKNVEHVSGNVYGCIASAVSSLTSNIIEAKEASSNAELTLKNMTSEQTQEIKQTIKDVEVQCTNLFEKLGNAQELLSKSSERLSESISTSINDVKESVVSEIAKNARTIFDAITGEVSRISQGIENASKTSIDSLEILAETISEGNTSLSNKVESLEKQTLALSSDLKKMTDPDSKLKDSLQSIQEQCTSMQRGLAEAKIQSSNIKDSLNSLISRNSNAIIIESIKKLIDNLHKDLKSSVSDINEELLESQIKQESTIDQLSRLQTLLRNIPIASSSAQSSVTATTIQTSAPAQSNRTVASSALKTAVSPQSEVKTEPTKPEVKNRPAVVKQEPNPNRTESIVDSQTSNVVLNQYVNGTLAKSIMKDDKSHLLFEIEYKNGQIVRSRNYDKKGNVNIEQTYYDNGQVQFRYEFTADGKKTTEFDRNGKRK